MSEEPDDQDDLEAVARRNAHRDLVDPERIDFTAHLRPGQQFAYAYLLTYAESIEDDFTATVLRKWIGISPSVGPVTRNRAEQLTEILRAPPNETVERTIHAPERRGLFRRRRPRHHDGVPGDTD